MTPKGHTHLLKGSSKARNRHFLGSSLRKLLSCSSDWSMLEGQRERRREPQKEFWLQMLPILLPQVCVCVCVVPNVEEDQLSRAVHVGFISQLLEEAGELGSEQLAALAGDAAEEKQQDAVLQARRDLPLRVQLVLVRVVLHQDPVDEQIHHGGRGTGKRGVGRRGEEDRTEEKTENICKVS